MRGRGSVVGIVVLTMGIMFATPGAGAPLARPRAPAAVARPNIVLILADDMRWDELENMPNTLAFLATGGVRFTQAYVPNSLCCPSRASILTGQYSDNNGVWGNAAPSGGFRAFAYGYTRADGIVVTPHESHTIAVDLHTAGYRTGLVGKYLNQYTAASAKGLAARPGWDDWITFLGGPNYFNYTLDRNGTSTAYATGAANYSTDVLATDAVSFITTAPAAQPFFLEFAPYAPHAPFTPAPRYTTSLPTCAGTAFPPGCYKKYTSPNLFEADVSDKPAWVRALAPNAKATWNATRKKQEQTLLAVDDAVGRIQTALTASGRLSNTLVVFMSDNSLSGGSHRWTDKQSPWDEAIHVPLLVRYDPLTSGRAGTVDGSSTPLNIDLAPTFGALTGIAPPTGVWAYDGQSILPVIGGTATLTRPYFALEHVLGPPGEPQIPSYCGVRTNGYSGAPGRWMYVRYSTGEEELYNLNADPWQLTSLDKLSAYATQKEELKELTQQICSPPPPGYLWS